MGIYFWDILIWLLIWDHYIDANNFAVFMVYFFVCYWFSNRYIFKFLILIITGEAGAVIRNSYADWVYVFVQLLLMWLGRSYWAINHYFLTLSLSIEDHMLLKVTLSISYFWHIKHLFDVCPYWEVVFFMKCLNYVK